MSGQPGEGAAALARGDAAAALSLAERALAAEASPEAHLLRARALLALGRHADARKAAKACLKLRLGDGEALELLDEIDDRIERERRPDASAAAGPSQAPPGPPAEPLLFGEYTLEQKLGEGGMGVVHLARSTSGQHLAVKTVAAHALGDERFRQAFLRELATWLAMPEHPNLVACRFFRSLDERILIFADYLDGGSLDRWIEGRRLTTVGAVLDVAIQAAWGLGAAHQVGVVHRDVKPANLLLCHDGTVKISDFGLARARSALPAQGALAGMTEAYCSPEQAAGQPLSFATDLWSWALTVLEMFAGRCPCRFGPEAPAALAACVSGDEPLAVPLPAPVAAVLERCFCLDPSGRWASMEEAAGELVRLHEPLTGEPYPRAAPAPPRPAHRAQRRYSGATWDAPHRWLRVAALAEGDPPPPLDDPASVSIEAQAASDLAAFEQAASRLERQLALGRSDLLEELAHLYRHKATAHLSAHDWTGSIRGYDRAIEILERLVHLDGRSDLVRPLGVCHGNAASAFRGLGDLRSASERYHRAIALWEPLVAQGRTDLIEALAMTLCNLGSEARQLGDLRACIALNERAAALFPSMPGADPKVLSSSHNNRLLALRELGDAEGALAASEQAIAVLEPLSRDAEQIEARNDLAMILLNRTSVLRDLGRHLQALDCVKECIAMRERLVLHEGHGEFFEDLALAYSALAVVCGDLGESRGKIEAGQRAVTLLERLVHQQGRFDVAPALAQAYSNLALEVQNMGDLRTAIALCERSLALWERLCAQQGGPEHEVGMAAACINLASALFADGKHREVVAVCDQAIARLDAAIAQGRPELLGSLVWLHVPRAQARWALDDLDGARSDASYALTTLPLEIDRTGRSDLLGVYSFAVEHFRPLLGACG